MERKTIWMNYLLIGISYVLLTALISCGQEEKDCLVKSEFIFRNESGFKIDVGIGVIQQDETFNFTQEYIGSCETDSNDYIPPFQMNTFVINDSLCITYNQISLNEGDGPFDISNYLVEKISDNNFRFTYAFDNEEFNGVIDCE